MRKLFFILAFLFLLLAFSSIVSAKDDIPLEKMNPEEVVSLKVKTIQDMVKYIKDLQNYVKEVTDMAEDTILGKKLLEREYAVMKDKCTF